VDLKTTAVAPATRLVDSADCHRAFHLIFTLPGYPVSALPRPEERPGPVELESSAGFLLSLRPASQISQSLGTPIRGAPAHRELQPCRAGPDRCGESLPPPGQGRVLHIEPEPTAGLRFAPPTIAPCVTRKTPHSC